MITPRPDNKKQSGGRALNGPSLVKRPKEGGIAVIGYAGRFPGADDADTFWSNLINGVDSVTDIPPDRWDFRDFFDRRPATPFKSYCTRGGFLNDIERFDYSFFGISRDEAVMMDPKQRLLLETVNHGLEHAGYGGSALSGSLTGVFIGSSYNYHEREMPVKNVISPHGMLGISNTLLANRVSHLFDFKGPSCLVDTFCSSSLIAVHLACQSILNGECQSAVAGGVHVLSFIHYICLSQFRALSVDGKCKTFDQGANGFVPGEGVGVVILKPYKEALDDGDTIHGIIRGTAVNHSGRSNNLTSPNPEAQTALIENAYCAADVDFNDVTYIETHGTGTELGDPLEIRALKKAFKPHTDRVGYCYLGSVKTNIGHLEPASGIAGLIKILLCIKHQTIPPVLHLNRLNRFISVDQSPFRINRRAVPWPAHNTKRVAGVSSFGLSGSNIHMVIEAPPEPPPAERTEAFPGSILFTVSAKTRAALDRQVSRLAAFIAKSSPPPLAEVCYTQALGRSVFPYRFAVQCTSLEDLRDRLNRFASQGVDVGNNSGRTCTGGINAAFNTGFLFGAPLRPSLSDMSLFFRYELFREAFMDTARLIGTCSNDPAAKKELAAFRGDKPPKQLRIGPHGAFVFQSALFRLLDAWGIRPVLMAGTGIGAVSAAYLSGAIGLATAVASLESLSRNPSRSIEIRPAAAPRHTLVVHTPGFPASSLNLGDRFHILCDGKPEEASALITTCKEQMSDVHMVCWGLPPDNDTAAASPHDPIHIPVSGKSSGLWDEVVAGVGELFVKGARIDWNAFFHGASGRRVPLPGYPFEGERLAIPEGRGPSISEKIINLARFGREYTADRGESPVEADAPRTSPPAAADDMAACLIDCIERKSGVSRDAFDPDTSFEEINIDSILKVELSYEILEKYPDLEQVGDALVAADTINEFLSIVHNSGHRTCMAAEQSREAGSCEYDIRLIHEDQKQNKNNFVCAVPDIVNKTVPRLASHLLVDEKHPFFFDHPLDHVSGLHLLESLIQAATTAFNLKKRSAGFTPVFFNGVHIRFTSMCPKDVRAQIEIHGLDFVDGGSNADLFKAQVRHNDAVCCSADFKIMAFDHPGMAPPGKEPRGESGGDVLFRACPHGLVNKQDPRNVIISEPLDNTRDVENMRFGLMPLKHHPYFSDYAGTHIPCVYFLEAFRQTQRYLQNIKEKPDTAGQSRAGFLMSLSLSLSRPVLRDETVLLEIDRISPKHVGANLFVKATGRILSGGVALGDCRTESLILAVSAGRSFGKTEADVLER